MEYELRTGGVILRASQPNLFFSQIATIRIEHGFTQGAVLEKRFAEAHTRACAAHSTS